jgi:hypothetical protein
MPAIIALKRQNEARTSACKSRTTTQSLRLMKLPSSRVFLTSVAAEARQVLLCFGPLMGSEYHEIVSPLPTQTAARTRGREMRRRESSAPQRAARRMGLPSSATTCRGRLISRSGVCSTSRPCPCARGIGTAKPQSLRATGRRSGWHPAGIPRCRNDVIEALPRRRLLRGSDKPPPGPRVARERTSCTTCTHPGQLSSAIRRHRTT